MLLVVSGFFLALTLSTALAHGKATSTTTKRDPLDRPNFVLFFVDDLGYGDCGFTGHPTSQTPNIDSLAWNGKILTTWYSACAVCSCSRASLLTGRQWPRTGVQEVFPRLAHGGLPLNETTIAEQLRKQNYSTAIVGKWHLGQRLAYLPGNQGFDYYLGLPYSVDMGNARYSTCPNVDFEVNTIYPSKKTDRINHRLNENESTDFWSSMLNYDQSNFTPPPPEDNDYAAEYIPLVYQEFNRTKIVQQPVDFTTLAGHYVDFAQTYIGRHQDQPFLLYVPFSHVHMTAGYTSTWEQRPNCQYADCQHQNTSPRGSFGDALAEVDWMVGRVMDSIRQFGLEENTLVVFTSDNGPWIGGGLDGGSAGIFQGRFATYSNGTGKGSTWEGGLREPAFAYWKGQIAPHSRSSETISTMDIFPTFSYLAGIATPNATTSSSADVDGNTATGGAVKLDGRNMADILLRKNGKSQHDFLFFYGFCNGGWPHNNITAVRHGPYKAHFCTGPGGGGRPGDVIRYHPYPLLFQVDQDPSEAFPISTGEMPIDPNHAAAMRRIMRAYAVEVATFEYGTLEPLPPGPGEGPGRYGLCCDRSLNCSCTTDVSHRQPWKRMGLFNIGHPAHHDRYHELLGEVNHMRSTNNEDRH